MPRKRARPIHADADRPGEAKTASPTGSGGSSLRDPGLGIGEQDDPMFTVNASRPHMVQLDETPDDPARVFYQGSFGGWTDKNPGMLGTGSRLHLVTGQPDAAYDRLIAEGTPDERLTHASFFSGVGGLDMGFDRAGWRTVSFSEIDPYAIEVLGRHWPEVPNLGSIVDLVEDEGVEGLGREPDDVRRARIDELVGTVGRSRAGDAGEDALGDLAAGLEHEGRSDERGVEDAPGGRPRARGTRSGDPSDARGPASDRDGRSVGSGVEGPVGTDDRRAWTRAALWTGGFPCQDLSVAGKRRGMGAGTRSGLAFAFLDLAARYRPRFILLENVPGLLSSHRGRDMAALLGALVELGYGVAYRVLDSQYFGVPQRRRRVFILADSTGGHPGAERAAEILSVGSVCHRHPPQGIEAWEGAPDSAAVGSVLAREGKGVGHNFPDDHLVRGSDPERGRDGLGVPHPDIVGTIAAGLGHHGQAGNSRQAVNAGHVIPELVGTLHTQMGAHTGQDDRGRFLVPADDGSPPVDADRVREADGLAGRLDDRRGLEGSEGSEARVAQGFRRAGRGPVTFGDVTPTLLDASQGGSSHLFVKSDVAPQAFRKASKAKGSTDLDEERWEEDDVLDTLPVSHPVQASALVGEGPSEEVDLLPLGLDSHRYRCCGNGVVADVAYWLAERIADEIRRESEA